MQGRCGRPNRTPGAPARHRERADQPPRGATARDRARSRLDRAGRVGAGLARGPGGGAGGGAERLRGAQGQDDRHVDPRYRRLAAERARGLDGDRALQALRQGDVRLRRQLLLCRGPVRRAVPEGGRLVADRVGRVQHHHQRQPVARRPGRAGLDPPAQRSDRRQPGAQHPVRAGRRRSPTGSTRTAPTRSGASRRKATRSPSSSARISSPTRPSATPTRPPTAAKTCPRPSTNG